MATLDTFCPPLCKAIRQTHGSHHITLTNAALWPVIYYRCDYFAQGLTQKLCLAKSVAKIFVVVKTDRQTDKKTSTSRNIDIQTDRYSELSDAYCQ